MTARGFALLLLLSAVTAAGAAYASAFLPGPTPGWAPWALAGGTVGSMVAMMVLGAARGGSVGSLGRVFAAVGLVVGVGFALLLALPAADPAEPSLLLGLPLRAAVLLYGVGLLPTLLVPVAYAVTFERLTLADDDLERVRRAGELRRGRPSGRRGEEG